MGRYAPIDMEELARTTAAKMDRIARQAYAPAQPVRILECWMCMGYGRDEDGSRCFNCGSKGRIATDSEFEV
jgi:hypothetical protein